MVSKERKKERYSKGKKNLDADKIWFYEHQTIFLLNCPKKKQNSGCVA